MSNKIEKIQPTSTVKMLIAVRRKKDNPNSTSKDELCYRQIIRGPLHQEIQNLRSRCGPGVWRILETVNARDTKKAAKLVQHTLLDNFEQWHYRIDTLFKTMLLQPECRFTKYFMLDCDTKNLDDIVEVIESNNLDVVDFRESVSGYHVVVEPFNPNGVKFPSTITVLRDGYVFVQKFEVADGKKVEKS